MNHHSFACSFRALVTSQRLTVTLTLIIGIFAFMWPIGTMSLYSGVKAYATLSQCIFLCNDSLTTSSVGGIEIKWNTTPSAQLSGAASPPGWTPKLASFIRSDNEYFIASWMIISSQGLNVTLTKRFTSSVIEPSHLKIFKKKKNEGRDRRRTSIRLV